MLFVVLFLVIVLCERVRQTAVDGGMPPTPLQQPRRDGVRGLGLPASGGGVRLPVHATRRVEPSEGRYCEC